VRKLLIAGVLVGALAVPAAAMGATRTYAGKINGGGKISVDVDVQHKKPVEILKTRVKKVPADCDVTQNAIIGGSITYDNVFVDQDGKFKIDSDPDPDGNEVFQTGTFSHHNKVLKGKFQVTFHFEGPSQNCTTDKSGYTAKRTTTKMKHVGKAAMIVRAR
jgi:hypothetical protein